MLKQIFRSKSVMIFSLMCVLICPNVFAWGGHEGGRHDGGRYYFHDGRWHGNHGWFWFDLGVTALTIGAIAETLPPRYTTVVAAGTPYYYCDGTYYQPYSSGGYVVVPAPASAPVVTSSQAEQNTFTVNIPDSKGGYTAVIIEKIKGGFRGPQGEFYSEFPSVEQLRLMYGNRK